MLTVKLGVIQGLYNVLTYYKVCESMKLPDLSHEIELWKKGYMVIGIDEVGRGAFAGPLYVGGVIFDPRSDIQYLTSIGINDSKKLKPNIRKMLSKVIQKECLAYHISTIDVAQINRIGIGKATFQAMRNTVQNLTVSLRAARSNLVKEIATSSSTPREDRIFVLVDGFYIKYLKGIGLKNQKGIVGGDGISLSIAAASIIAKVARDEHMEKLSAKFPNYGWGRNKGYGTLSHRQTLQKLGITRLHRKAFIKNLSCYSWSSSL